MCCCREAAETLLFLNGTDPEDPPGATAAASESPKSRPKAEDGAATDVSPLQALVQDIMQRQKQRAQVPNSCIPRCPLLLSSLFSVFIFIYESHATDLKSLVRP